MHDERVDEAACWMFKRFRQTANDCKTEALPQANGTLVGADHEIVLHGPEAAFAGAFQRMGAHSASHTASHSFGRCDVSAIRNVCPTALLIGPQNVRPDNPVVFFGDENFVVGR